MLERDPSPGAHRAAAAALRPHAHRIPKTKLDAWLTPAQPPRLRRHAAALLRAADTWSRLEADLRLADDADPALAREARDDLRAWASTPTSGYRQPATEQRALLLNLLRGAEASLDDRTSRLLRFALAERNSWEVP